MGFLQLDATKIKSIQAASYLFENLFFGVGLPDAWVKTIPSGDGFVWDKDGTANPNNGHCYIGFGHDKQGVKIDTWALKGNCTYAACAAYCTQATGGMLYSLLTPDQIFKGMAKAPNGIDWTSLVSDFRAMGGKFL